MIINIEPTLVYCFMFFTTVVITPVLYYVYRIIRDVLAYQGREFLIYQCARIFKENESLVKNTLYSFFDIAGNVERNIFDYFSRNQLYGSIGYTCDKIFDVLKTYLTNTYSSNQYYTNYVPCYNVTPDTRVCESSYSGLSDNIYMDNTRYNDLPYTDYCNYDQSTFGDISTYNESTPNDISTYCTGRIPNNGSISCNFSRNSSSKQSLKSRNSRRRNVRNNRSLRNSLRGKKVRFAPNEFNTTKTDNLSGTENILQNNEHNSLSNNDDIYSMVSNKYASVIRDLNLDDKYIESFNKCIQLMKNNPDMKSEDCINEVFNTMLSGIGLQKITTVSPPSETVTIEDCEFDD
ncbi:hypothetical protein H012_gp590 [Acanthamoeba polyphaga moumouvirus]|uniref:Uncharacterized protein n=1 Tax=Acanthamoeba polyphaga moumouvirus TaxID=1269028 RepID=L7RCV0_9VIRU|nr:hypothetical protein H012_gp590 [Acanthamoeba polyphaga moumouvirus]AGC01873.1 hypothetical protein Moumou_00333 [Acanthamoeba polyphaga moumouvirus]